MNANQPQAECNCETCRLGARLGLSREILDATLHVAVAVKLMRTGVLPGSVVDDMVAYCLDKPSPANAFADEVRKVLKLLASPVGVSGQGVVKTIIALAQPAKETPAKTPWPDWALGPSKN